MQQSVYVFHAAKCRCFLMRRNYICFFLFIIYYLLFIIYYLFIIFSHKSKFFATTTHFLKKRSRSFFRRCYTVNQSTQKLHVLSCGEINGFLSALLSACYQLVIGFIMQRNYMFFHAAKCIRFSCSEIIRFFMQQSVYVFHAAKLYVTR